MSRTPTLVEVLTELDTLTQPVTTADLADRLGGDPEVVAGMVDWLRRSGRLGAPPPSCGPTCNAAVCRGCPLADVIATDLRRRP